MKTKLFLMTVLLLVASLLLVTQGTALAQEPTDADSLPRDETPTHIAAHTQSTTDPAFPPWQKSHAPKSQVVIPATERQIPEESMQMARLKL